MTSYNELRRDALDVRTLEPSASGREGETAVRRAVPRGHRGPIVAATDYMKAMPDQIARYMPRAADLARHRRLRPQRRPQRPPGFFEVDAAHVVHATLSALARDGKVAQSVVQQAVSDFGINPDKPNPATL